MPIQCILIFIAFLFSLSGGKPPFFPIPHTVDLHLAFSFLFVGDVPGHYICFQYKTDSIGFVLPRAHYTNKSPNIYINALLCKEKFA